jgi:hypothetical protein
MRTKILSTLRWSGVFALVLASAASCGVKDDIEQATESCDEVENGASAAANLNVNAKVKAFAQASAELKEVSQSIRADVKAACVAIAVDLGETDVWSNDSGDDSISNLAKSGACDVVAARIDSIMTAATAAGASFALQISGGECSVNADVQTDCEQSCKTDVTCTEPTVETRCTPGELSGQCDANCVGEATCEGKIEAAAECMGTCEAECEGSCNGELHGTTDGGCDGMCIGKCDGVKTPAGGMANCEGKCEGRCTRPRATARCQGKCTASCHGKCKGQCKLEKEAAMNCGANVRCKGGCTTTYTEPVCETELTPPVCTGNTECQTSCSARASAAAECSPPSVTLVTDVDVSEDVAKLKATLEAHLPNILLAARAKGQLALRAIESVADAGESVVKASAKLGVKDVACAGTAATASARAAVSMGISVNASVKVTSSCTAHAS